MKKKEIIFIAVLAIVSLLSIGIMKGVFKPSTPASEPSSETADPAETADSEVTADPAETAEAEEKKPTDPALVTVDIYKGNTIIKSFNPSVDNVFTIQGDYGTMHVEVKDGKWHVAEDVECPNKICTGMGWMGPDDIIPISCLPNDVYVVVR